MNRSRHGAIILFGLILGLAAHAGFAPVDQTSARSSSGQFLVSGGGPSPLFRRYPDLKDDPNLVRLDPALLAVSAERARDFFWRQLGWPGGAPWRGKIYFRLRPAVTLDDPVTISARAFGGVWDFSVDLPDLLTRARFARTLAGVILVERANEQSLADGGTAQVPSWLADGLAQQLLAGDNADILLSSPERSAALQAWVGTDPSRSSSPIQTLDRSPESRVMKKRRGVDPLASPRMVLQRNSALTFDQLSWPDDTQAAGDDGGVYYASAQLFVSELLAVKNGPAKMRDLITQLPAYMNWQTAFFQAFHDDFTRPLEVEKWWALRVVTFAAHDPGPRWTLAASREKLDALLRIPAEMRTGSNALPVLTEISLQDAIAGFATDARNTLLENRLRDLQLAQIRLALPYVMLAREYSTVLADYLGEPRRNIQLGRRGRASAVSYHHVNQPAVLQKLTALDARRNLLARQLNLDYTEK